MIRRFRKLFKVKNIYEVTLPFYRISKIFGIGCYSLNFQSTEIRETKLDKLFFATSLLSYLTIYGIFLKKTSFLLLSATILKLSEQDESTFLNYVSAFQFVFTVSVALWLVIFDFVKRNQAKKFLTQINLFDKKFSNYTQTNAIKYFYVRTVGIIGIPLIPYMITQLIINIRNFRWFTIISGRAAMTCIFIAFQFTFSLSIITNRLKLITKFLK